MEKYPKFVLKSYRDDEKEIYSVLPLDVFHHRHSFDSTRCECGPDIKVHPEYFLVIHNEVKENK